MLYGLPHVPVSAFAVYAAELQKHCEITLAHIAPCTHLSTPVVHTELTLYPAHIDVHKRHAFLKIDMNVKVQTIADTDIYKIAISNW